MIESQLHAALLTPLHLSGLTWRRRRSRRTVGGPGPLRTAWRGRPRCGPRSGFGIQISYRTSSTLPRVDEEKLIRVRSPEDLDDTEQATLAEVRSAARN